MDTYERKARVFPAWVVGLPCALFGIVIRVTETAWWPTIAGAVVGSGFFMVAAQIGRYRGKKREPELFDAWGGKPTTRLLRHTGPMNPVSLARIQGQLEALTGILMPTAQDEAADPSQSGRGVRDGRRCSPDARETRGSFLWWAKTPEIASDGSCRNDAVVASGQ